MSSNREVVHPLQGLDLSDVPPPLREELAEHLREEAQDPVWEARLGALVAATAPFTPPNKRIWHDQTLLDRRFSSTVSSIRGARRLIRERTLRGVEQITPENQSSPNIQTLYETEHCISPLASPLAPNEPMDQATFGNWSSPSWQTTDDTEFFLPSPDDHSTSPYETVAADGVLSGDQASTYRQTEDELCLSCFNDSALPLSVSSMFDSSPGSDRQMPLFTKFGNYPYRQFQLEASPLRILLSPSFSFVGDDGEFSASPSRLKQDYRVASAQMLRGESSSAEWLSRGDSPSERNPSTPSNLAQSTIDESTTEPPSFLTDIDPHRDELDSNNPFYGRSPKTYPSVEVSNNGLSYHNGYNAPVNRSHKLLLDLKAARVEAAQLKVAKIAAKLKATEQDAIEPPSSFVSAEGGMLVLGATDWSPTPQFFTSSNQNSTKATAMELPKNWQPLNKASLWKTFTYLALHTVGRK